MKTSELTGAALDWAVGMCTGTTGKTPERCFDCQYHEERSVRDGGEHYCHFPQVDGPHWYSDGSGDGDYFGDGISADIGVHRLCPRKTMALPYSTNWAQGGPIIEREKIGLLQPNAVTDFWVALSHNPATKMAGERAFSGTTPLIAAMRCYVASKLGDEVNLPEELK